MPDTPAPILETQSEDPNHWLETVEGDAALAWVRAQNARSLAELQADPRYAGFEAAALDALNSSERIPYGAVRDGMVYNFWQDDVNVRGLWRRTRLDSYATAEPVWETVVDFDMLAAEEGKNWVYKGANCLRQLGQPVRHCLVSLSDGGKDAVVNREFDLVTKTFVADGFVTPEAKQGVAWVDADPFLLVAAGWRSRTRALANPAEIVAERHLQGPVLGVARGRLGAGRPGANVPVRRPGCL